MNNLYNFVISLAGIVLKILAVFNKKIALFVNGRKQTFSRLQSQIKPNDKTIWIHCASLGEFEQGRPIIEKLRKSKPSYKIVLSFFSPSGYEVRKDYEEVDIVVYLPLDSAKNAKKFIDLVQPSLAIFVKYEFWPNILKELKRNSIQTILISGIFREDQIFFKFYGGWMKNSLHSFSHFFVQNENSQKLLQTIGVDKVTISGDTRFDSVNTILGQENRLDFLEDFVKGKQVLVAGSTWPIDESYLISFLNMKQAENFRCIIAPHNINPKEIEKLKNNIHLETALYSEGQINKTAKVFIVDTIGILTKIYSYADMAYVGGGFDKEGVHNVLEPAVFSIPLVIGPIYDKFEEAKELVALNGCLVASDEIQLFDHLNELNNNENYRLKIGNIAGSYIKNNIGATEIILNYIEQQLGDNS
ncbi:glycosyltransferase N-terminal domain-containing protein [Lutimonas halocynthiae]|uniref:3-deoxy-D-manno-octulosonic acid transferase n=1 Tax=Lutimonas halocynthiae TaxID=1446477 RepID=UPI0025B40AEF|nr:glycosyltransferase N-terminal domain-containing protein [Lutimonas halocynthiae]MDN3641263.1 glycosyltransferase N-terminal domain-containing protein [Lutimonas halocynthiae]